MAGVFYSDPGHGWVAVKKKFLAELGIADKITPYSYHKGKTAYLEEDCDYSTLIDACKKHGIIVKLKEKTTNKRSVIRSYHRYLIA